MREKMNLHLYNTAGGSGGVEGTSSNECHVSSVRTPKGNASYMLLHSAPLNETLTCLSLFELQMEGKKKRRCKKIKRLPSGFAPASVNEKKRDGGLSVWNSCQMKDKETINGEMRQ